MSQRLARVSALRRVRFDDPVTTTQDRQVKDALAEIAKVELLDGRLMVQRPGTTPAATSWISLTVGSITKIKHDLGRKLRGWLLVDLLTTDAVTAAGMVLRLDRDGTTFPDDTEDLWLKPIGFTGVTTIKVRIWLF